MTIVRRTLTLFAALTLGTSLPSMAQGTAAMADPDKLVKGGSLPAGWTGRTDRANEKLGDVKFVTMGQGYHVTSGPAGIYWNRAHLLKAPFTLTASMTQTKAPAHPEAYGVFFMGSKLDAPDQSYAYVVVRGNGDMLVRHRAGTELHTIMDWAPNAAVRKQDASGAATNVFRVTAGADSTRVFINGAPVFALATDYAGPGGYVGLRVNHNLDVHVGEYTVTRGGSAAAPTTVRKAKPKPKTKQGAARA